MRKYLEIGRISLKTQMTYRFDVYIGSLMPFIRVFLAYFLWRMMYTGKSVIGGMTFGMMLTYYIVCAFIERLEQSNGMVWDMAGEIREGKFSKYLVKPVSPLGHFVFTSLAKSLYILFITIVAVGIIALIYSKEFVPPVLSINLLYAVIITLLGLVFIILLNYLTALLAFKYTDITGWHLIKSNMVDFLSGALLPLSLLPLWMQGIMKFFPFYYMQYIPASLYLGLKTDEAILGIVILVIWNLFLWFLAEAAYNRFRRLYEGVGA
ncbi:MAG: ABC-2 family transporter protein [Clostridia bacterium]|nr:ABC-2 family transporter protein [Clostridia bacterium]